MRNTTEQEKSSYRCSERTGCNKINIDSCGKKELLTGSNAYYLTHLICAAQDIVSRPEKPHSGRKEKAVGKNSREIAESYFIRISDGHKNAMQRPADPNVDRALRRMIEKANCDGDCIVNTGKGYSDRYQVIQ